MDQLGKFHQLPQFQFQVLLQVHMFGQQVQQHRVLLLRQVLLQRIQ